MPPSRKEINDVTRRQSRAMATEDSLITIIVQGLIGLAQFRQSNRKFAFTNHSSAAAGMTVWERRWLEVQTLLARPTPRPLSRSRIKPLLDPT
jgi:hypothetical protein